MKLSDRTLEFLIHSLTKASRVNKIFIIRDKQGPNLPKVEYICPPKYVVNCSPLSFLYKLISIIMCSFKHNISYIHSYLLFPHGFLAFICAKMLRKPVGVSLIAGPQEIFELGSSPNKFSYTRPLPPLNQLSKFIIYILNKFSVVTVTGSFTKDFLISNGVKTKIYTLSHFVNPELFDSNFINHNCEKVYDLIYIGRLVQNKNLDSLIDVVNELSRSINNLKFVIVGDGANLKTIQDKVSRLNLDSNIIFTGYQSEVWRFLNKSKIFIFASEREGFPLVVVEALSCGVPVVSSKCGDVVDLIVDGYNGYIVSDHNDHLAYSKLIQNILSDEQLYNRLVCNALETVSHFSIEKLSAVWNTILTDLAL